MPELGLLGGTSGSDLSQAKKEVAASQIRRGLAARFQRMIIIDGRGAATPEDEKVCLDQEPPGGGNFGCEQAKGRGLIRCLKKLGYNTLAAE